MKLIFGLFLLAISGGFTRDFCSLKYLGVQWFSSNYSMSQLELESGPITDLLCQLEQQTTIRNILQLIQKMEEEISTEVEISTFCNGLKFIKESTSGQTGQYFESELCKF